jgi:hypothetical protein
VLYVKNKKALTYHTEHLRSYGHPLLAVGPAGQRCRAERGVIHLLKTKHAFLETQLQALMLNTLKHKTLVLKLLLKGATLDTHVVKVDYVKLM